MKLPCFQHDSYFIALADAIREHNRTNNNPFTAEQMMVLAEVCRDSNYQFNRSRWLAYIAGECGPNGGAVKGRAA